jgi:uncharacterized protein YqjF (DUF2071 family)
MGQRWNNLLFAHWPVAAGIMRAMVPRALELDLHDGTAWVSVTPFYLSHLRARGVPALPWISAFPETNVRTYVTIGGKPGVYFFSLDAGSALAVMGARTLYHLPYFRAAMSIRTTPDGMISYHTRRTHGGAPPAVLSARYRPTGAAFRSAPGSLDHWLSERYCLYAVDSMAQVYRAEIHHVHWPLQPAEAEIDKNTMALAAGIALPSEPPRLAFASSIDVLVWPPTRVRA